MKLFLVTFSDKEDAGEFLTLEAGDRPTKGNFRLLNWVDEF
ncbi:hypothetical protein [Microcoleus sp. FACHB-831]|nr:hypothetical protein [Microcoleus sp. FACHB-831]